MPGKGRGGTTRIRLSRTHVKQESDMIMDHSLSDRLRPLVFILCCSGYLFPAAGQSQYQAQLRALSYEASEASVRTAEASVASPAPGPNVADGVSAAFRVTNTNDTGPGSLR